MPSPLGRERRDEPTRTASLFLLAACNAPLQPSIDTSEATVCRVLKETSVRAKSLTHAEGPSNIVDIADYKGLGSAEVPTEQQPPQTDEPS